MTNLTRIGNLKEELTFKAQNEYPIVLLGNSSKRFSGVTSTMLQVLRFQARKTTVIVVGRSFVPSHEHTLTFWDLAFRSKNWLGRTGSKLVFHARRNDEMIQALLLKWFFRVDMKVVFTSTAQRKKTWITRWLMGKMDGLISTCTAASAFMEKPPDIIVPHGIDINTFDRPDRALPYGLPGKFNIGIFGRVRKQKGVDLLVDAALNILPDYKDWGVVVVGQITDANKTFVEEQLARISNAKLGDRIVFTNELDLPDVVESIKQVDIVTALSVNEGFGLTVLEGMAAKKPVVATKAGAWPDIMSKSMMGYLIDIGDRKALEKALTSLMEDSSKRFELGHNGRSLLESDYTLEREAMELLEFYKKVAKSS